MNSYQTRMLQIVIVCTANLAISTSHNLNEGRLPEMRENLQISRHKEGLDA